MASVEHSTSPVEDERKYTVVPLQPRLSLHGLSPQFNAETGRKETPLERAIRHRLRLHPPDGDAVDFNGRTAETTYVYKSNKRGSAHVMPSCYGNEEHQVYQVPTHSLPKHLLSFLGDRGRWHLVTFPHPVAPDEVPTMLPIPRRKKPRTT